MKASKFERPVSYLSEQDLKRRKREFSLILVIIALIILLTIIETRVIRFGLDFPISNTILMFIVININLLLLILLIFLVFRNIVKLLYDRKRKVMGSGLRTKLVVAFISLTLMPTTVLFFFSINFITTSIQFWFNVPVEQALQNSLIVGRQLYEYVETHNRFYLEQISYHIKAKKLIDSQKRDTLLNYIQNARRYYNVDAIEVYAKDSQRIAVAFSSEFADNPLNPIKPDDLSREVGSKHVRSISVHTSKGEISQTIGTIPFGYKQDDTEAILVLSTLIPQGLSESLGLISRGIEEYQQIKLLKEPIQSTYYITLSIVVLLVLFCAIWFGFYLAKTITIPIKELAEGTRRVAEGDLSFSIAQVADDEIGSLVDSFNKMTKDLRTGRDQLELSSRKLREQNVEIEERRRYMEIVLKNVSTGVITLDAHGLITTANKSAERMLNIRAEKVLNKNYAELLKGQHLELADEIMEHLSKSLNDAVDLPLRLTIDGATRSFMAYINALKDDSGNYIGIVMVFDDLTEQEKAQRMAAWREVARRIAHEVKNPLTPISLSAQRLKRKYSCLINEPVFDECTQMIIDHVELIRNLVNEFSAFARFPTANPKPCDLPPIIEETVALYREGHPNVHFKVKIAENIPKLNLDRQQIKQAMINLVDNAVAAIRQDGYIFIALSHDADLKNVQIEVADTGNGISDEEKARLFEPYFSTKKSGMGLGLTIVNSIIADHHGTIQVQDNHPRGAIFTIELPV